MISKMTQVRLIKIIAAFRWATPRWFERGIHMQAGSLRYRIPYINQLLTNFAIFKFIVLSHNLTFNS